MTAANLVTSARILLLAPLFALLVDAPQGSWPAFAVLVIAGLSDVIDGRLARAMNQTSKLGAMLDLMADRLLTLAVVMAFAASGALKGAALVAGLVLAGRCVLVAGFGEAVAGLDFRVTAIEKLKIALQFLGFGLLAAPALESGQHVVGSWSLMASAALTCVTVAGYARKTLSRLQQA